MIEPRPVEYTPSDASDTGEQTPEAEEEPRTPLAWFEIETVTFGEFKKIIRVPFFKGQIIAIGRDAKACNLRFQCKAVSSVHCEIYSVLFDKTAKFRPLIYIRDCQSKTGTFVNNQLVGKEPFVTAARILENDDLISVGPCTLRLCDYVISGEEPALSLSQQKEASQFADQFLIKDTILGAGSFATVHMAVNVQTNQQVVCKIHDLSSLRNRYETIVQRVDREMSIWSQLDHPNIVAFQRAFHTSNTMYTFGDLATGGDLYTLLEREKSIPELEIKWIIVQLLRAVDYLHSKGVAHRDIKLENILCSSSVHFSHRIALADFGCAGVTSLGRMTSDVGTNIYRAPEVQPTGKPHGVAVDIWAVGVLALQLLSGYHTVAVEPFESSCAKDIEDMVVSVNLSRTGEETGPISQNGIDFIIACLNLRPHERPTAVGAAKHAWLRESEQEVIMFKEREKKLAWKPRGIIIPAVVRLEDVDQVTSANKTQLVDEQANSTEDKALAKQLRYSHGQEETTGQLSSSLPIPDSVERSQAPRYIHQRNIEWLKGRSETMVDPERSYSMINYRSTTVA